MNIFVNIDIFIHLYIFRLLCNAHMQKEKDEEQKPDKKKVRDCGLKKLFSKYIIIISEVLSESARSAFSRKTDDISNEKSKNANFCKNPYGF